MVAAAAATASAATSSRPGRASARRAPSSSGRPLCRGRGAPVRAPRSVSTTGRRAAAYAGAADGERGERDDAGDDDRVRPADDAARRQLVEVVQQVGGRSAHEQGPADHARERRRQRHDRRLQP